MKKISEILATIATIAGLYLLSEHNPIGFYIGGLGNLFWLVYASLPKQYGILLVNLILLVINVNGLTNS